MSADLMACPCGSAWFVLRNDEPNHPAPHGAICVDIDGSVTAYTGRVVCLECGTEHDPALGVLRVVRTRYILKGGPLRTAFQCEGQG